MLFFQRIWENVSRHRLFVMKVAEFPKLASNMVAYLFNLDCTYIQDRCKVSVI